MSYDDALFEAILQVLDTDLSDEVCYEAVSNRAALLSGHESDGPCHWNQ